MSNKNNNLWGIVLAGGEGTRLRNYVNRKYGYSRPKQYCRFIGSRSMVQHTVERMNLLIPYYRIMMIANSSHSEFITEEFGEEPIINIVEQPCMRETSAGILLPLSKIHYADPNSTIVMFPSDHFILEEEKFMGFVQSAVDFAEENPEKIVLLGINATQCEPGYGWIETGESYSNNIYDVKKFWEKPGPITTRILLDKKCLINTFVLIGKSKTILNCMNECIPSLMKSFDSIAFHIGRKYEKIMINRFFKYLPSYNFSKCVLEKNTKHLVVLKVKGIHWSDWGEEERLIEDLELIKYLIPDADVNYGKETINGIETKNPVIKQDFPVNSNSYTFSYFAEANRLDTSSQLTTFHQAFR
ncbi:MAG: sugar phosphate nucleotidyltransferase [Bacteroidota bacterium]